MMTNLFSSFDPSTSLFSLSWLLMLMTFLFFCPTVWKVSCSFVKVFKKLLILLKKDLFIILKKKEKKSSKLLVTAFFFILFMNIISLYPQVFSPTSQLAVTVPLSILFWISLMLFGWINNTSFMLSHLLPHGTPMILAVFMIFIELVSNIIRPITLSIRLAANLIAGHLLLIIMSNTLVYMSIYVSLLCFPINLLLTALELIVSFIQSYVFLILVTLYINETE